MMTEEELKRHGIRIEIEEERNFVPFRYPNTIIHATAYIVINGRREYVDSDSGAWDIDTDWLREEAIRKAEEYLKRQHH